MKTSRLLTAAAALTASIVLITACSKSETAAPAASQPTAAATMVADSTEGQTPMVPGNDSAMQASPGSPVATFTPDTGTPAPMLPTLESAPPPIDEHSQTPDKANVRRIAPEEVAMLVQSGDAILVDVRSKEYFDREHVKGAVNIPFAELSARAREELPPTRWIIPYCT